MIQKAFKNFKTEAENFFVTKFIVGPTLTKQYSKCLDVIYNLTGTMDTTKGIMAFNPKYGQGKSFFFDVVQHRHRRRYGHNLFFKTTARELCNIYTSTKNGEDPEQRLLKYIDVKRLFIDDIGDELKDGKERSNYANKLNVVRYVLLKRYELWIEKGWRTYGTTNLTIEQFGENYGGRVADRMLQMTYFEEFDFLESGSFRQIEETRKLTQEEIEHNWLKYKSKPKPMEKIDVDKFFNELINENEDYFEGKDTSFWTFIKDYLVRKKLLTQDDLDSIDVDDLDSAELLLRRDVRKTTRMSIQHAPGNVRNATIERALEDITKKKVYSVAENMIARKKFMELRKSKHIFK